MSLWKWKKVQEVLYAVVRMLLVDGRRKRRQASPEEHVPA